jgi:hypothetical protein
MTTIIPDAKGDPRLDAMSLLTINADSSSLKLALRSAAWKRSFSPAASANMQLLCGRRFAAVSNISAYSSMENATPLTKPSSRLRAAALLSKSSRPMKIW